MSSGSLGSVSLPQTSSAEQATDSAENSQFPDLGDRYEVLGILGEGGMGRVFKVRNKELDVIFAAKVLRPEFASDVQAQKRFEQEARAASSLTHPNLVPVHDFSQAADGSPYLVMELIDGETLAHILKGEGKLGFERAVEIFTQCCDALIYAHKKGIIHRDLKPSNIILTKTEAGADVVHLVDFGIAKVQTGSIRETQDLTQSGDVLGSPLYMSPEQCIGVALKAQSDIYSLGCVMYEVLSGRAPFGGSNPIQIIAQHLNEPPARLKQAAVPPGMETVILKCLQKEPGQRYANCEDLLEDLKRVQAGGKPLLVLPPDVSKPSFTLRKVIVACLLTLLLAVSAQAGLQIANIQISGGFILGSCYLIAAALILLFSFPYARRLWRRALLERERHRLWAAVGMSSLVVSIICSLPPVLFLQCMTLGLSDWFRHGSAALVVNILLAVLVFLLGSYLSAGAFAFSFCASFIERVFKTSLAKRWISYCVLGTAIIGLSFASYLALYPVSVSIALGVSLVNPGAGDRLVGWCMLINPKQTYPHFIRARIYENLYRKTLNPQLGAQALEKWNEYVNLAPDDVAGHMTRGLLLEDMHEYGSALKDFDQVVTIQPKVSANYSARGRVYAAMKNFAAAQNDFDKAIDLKPEDEYRYRDRALCYQSMNKLKEALHDIDTAVSYSPGNLEFRDQRSDIIAAKGDFEAAIPDLTFILAKYPDCQPILLKRGLLYKKLKMDFESARDIQRCHCLGDPSKLPEGLTEMQKANRFYWRALAAQALGKAAEYERTMNWAKESIISATASELNVKKSEVNADALLKTIKPIYE